MFTNEQLLAALNAVPPLEWASVGKNTMRAILPDGHIIEISRDGHATWILFVIHPQEEAPPVMTGGETTQVGAPLVVTFNTQEVFGTATMEPDVWQVGDDNTL